MTGPLRCLPLLLLGACASQELPSGSGEGLIAFDREPPEGSETWNLPVWREGDHLLFRKGGQIELSYRVKEVGEEGIRLLDESNRMVLLLSRELQIQGKEFPGDPWSRRVMDPLDYRFHWPLWVGKRWVCHFLEKVPGGPGIPKRVSYHCDAREEVRVPGGRFTCLRIWRRAELLIPGRTFMHNVSVVWYAPELGYVVRELEDGVLSELQEFHRQ